jgi:hypothetical protein
MILVGRSRDRSPVVSLGIFSVESDNSMCPGSTQPLKMNKTVRMVDKLQPSNVDVMKSGSLNLPELSGPHRPVMGLLHLYLSVLTTAQQ